MALTRRQWNNIIIFASIGMVASLTLLQQKTQPVPKNAVPLFDANTTLSQLSIDNNFLMFDGQHWRCQPIINNCEQWQQAWLNIHVSPVDVSEPPSDRYQSLSLTVSQSTLPQTWRLYSDDGLLQSASGNWYQIPPSLQSNLLPERATK